jgi:hypothetical protein
METAGLFKIVVTGTATSQFRRLATRLPTFYSRTHADPTQYDTSVYTQPYLVALSVDAALMPRLF